MCFAFHFTDISSAVIFCLDMPHKTQKDIEDKLASAHWSDSLAFHPILLSAVRDMYNSSVWALRDFIRKAEIQRTFDTPTSIVQPDFVHLHELARHVIHSNEVLDVALTTSQRLQARCMKSTRTRNSTKESQDREQDLCEQFEFLENDLFGIKRRSISLQERLQNEIQLVRNSRPTPSKRTAH
jgi:hypothetical protein